MNSYINPHNWYLSTPPTPFATLDARLVFPRQAFNQTFYPPNSWFYRRDQWLQRYRSWLQQVPPMQGGTERSGGRPPYPRIIDWHARYPQDVILKGPEKKEVALTFDDGPDGEYTPRILTVLSNYSVKATFMVIGTRIQEQPSVFQRMLREGHVVGNHTWNHLNLARENRETIRSELTRTSDEMQRVGGVRPLLFRPPYGALSEEVISVARELQYKIILWNVDSLDWTGIPTAQVTTNVLAHASLGSIVLMHSAGGPGEDLSNTVEALSRIINSLRSEGYAFKTIPQLLNISAYRT